MMNNKELLLNINKIHTTKLGHERIIKNLQLTEIDVVEYLKKRVLNENCKTYKKGKNYYCQIDNIIVTINSHNYCIITAHLIKSR